jgi:hypothetical protein
MSRSLPVNLDTQPHTSYVYARTAYSNLPLAELTVARLERLRISPPEWR